MNESRREIRWGKTDNNNIIIVIFCKKSAERLIVETELQIREILKIIQRYLFLISLRKHMLLSSLEQSRQGVI